MRKKLVVYSLLLACISSVGCKKDAEIGAVLKDLDQFTTELVQKVDSSQGSVEGINEAQKYLDSRKADMQKKLGVLKEARGFQVSDETKKVLTESITKNVTSVASLEIKYMSRSIKDPGYKSKLEKLVKDYRDLLTS
jgi:hypothetical protein